MHRSRTSALAVWLAVSMTLAAVHAQEAEPAGADATGIEAADPALELAALVAERDGSKMPSAQRYEAFRPQFEAFATSHPGTDEALSAQLWLLGQSWWLQRAEGKERMNEVAGEAAAAILRDHGESDRLGEMCKTDYVFSREQREEVFGQLTSSPHATVRAAAHYSLGKAQIPLAGENSDSGGKSRFELLLTDDYASVPYRYTTYGAMADAQLHPHAPSALAVGQPAPEIEGADLDGKPMRLSDYKGNVVVLDFWGDW